MKKTITIFKKSRNTKNSKVVLSFLVGFFSLGSAFSQYCIPTPTASSSYAILSVNFNTLSNSSGSSEGYVDRTSSVDSLILGNSYTITIGLTNPNAQGTIFIDWNQDMIFDSTAGSTEKYVRGFSMGSPFNITVPVGANLGVTRMRLMVKGPAGGNIENPCVSDATEVEDYGLNILPLPTGIKETNTQVETIFPNPSNNKIHISLKKPISFNTSLKDISGKLVNSEIFLNSKNVSINSSGFSNGIYFLTIETAERIETYKVIISH